MREILFRGKRLDGCSWIEGYYVEQYKAQMIYTPNVEVYGYEYYHIIPETVGQFTGLTDKNGKKIFEGDIVKDIYGRIESCHYNQARYCLMFKGVNYIRELVFVRESEYEVIGNIHDNPELLKENENERN